ncbi:hypothetical protein EEL31_10850 [Brevibacillus laterosporus]|nr:hypothetical protein EEL31_10850 [Brevibacillus laterosporus]
MQAGKQNIHFIHVQLGELLQELLEQWQVGQNHHIVLTKPEQKFLRESRYRSVDTGDSSNNGSLLDLTRRKASGCDMSP